MQVNEFRLKLFVRDFEIMREFYTIVLGLEPVGGWDNGSDDCGVLLDTGSGIVELISAGSEYKPVQGCDVSFGVDDVWKLWEELKSQSIVHPLRQNYWGDSSFCIRDPEGFRLTFFSKDKARVTESSAESST
jgi:catechol 2,3-dioxygenase-like lactoylglutathione lyase family enzyme